jgi:hypothetical protein
LIGTSKSIFIISLLLTLTYADTNTTLEEESNYIDDMHKTISQEVLEWSDKIDVTLSDWLEDDKNQTKKVEKVTELPDDTLEEKTNYVDSFFQTDKYLDETDNTYIRLRTEGYFQTKESADYGVRLSAQLPFKRSRKNLKIFINDVTDENAKNLLQDTDESPSLGLNYYRPENFGINSKYSLGFSGIDPFARARFNKLFTPGDWLIDIVQAFQYSTDDKFEEETNLFFDREIQDMGLFRTYLHRSTHQEIEGMDYAMSLQYYCCSKKNTGLRFSQTFIGNTEYPYVFNEGVEPPVTKTYGGINNYLTSVTWRRNVWRKWFYFELTPAVSFQKQYDWDPNYTVRLSFDFYFGKFD